MENIIEWTLAIFLYGIIAFFLNAFELEILSMLNVSSLYMDWIVILVTDVTAGVVFFSASIKLIRRGRERRQ